MDRKKQLAQQRRFEYCIFRQSADPDAHLQHQRKFPAPSGLNRNVETTHCVFFA
ncbi:MAG TPA: hypothetical protein PKY67_03110 [Nitrosomonas sp.]|nr:hypothetical protein [Nitrosomonas sp.]